MTRLILASLLLILPGLRAVAADDPPAPEPAPAEEIQQVSVSGIRNPELRSYRSLLAGLDAFEEKHRLAPKAEALRFTLKPRSSKESLAGIALRIVGGESSIPVPIAADGSFVLPRDKEAERNDADLILNRPKGAWNGGVEIRSANVPATMRRLGDLRLECQVVIAIAKTEINFLIRSAAAVALGGTDWCQSTKLHWGTEAPKLAGVSMLSDRVTLIDGERRLEVPIGRRKKYYNAPIQDRSWSDDTLIEFHPAAPASLADFTAEPFYLRGTMNKWDSKLPMKQIDATHFSVDVALPKGISKFKFASKDHRAIDIGTSDSGANETKGNLAVNVGKALAWGGKDVWFEPAQAGTYTFALDVADPQAPVLTITPRE